MLVALIQQQNECAGQLSDDVMIVCQLSENVTKDDLHEMFPDALDIVLPRDRIASVATEKLNAKGYFDYMLCEYLSRWH